MTQSEKTYGETEGRTEGRKDRHYFIGPFRPRPGVEKTHGLKANFKYMVAVYFKEHSDGVNTQNHLKTFVETK